MKQVEHKYNFLAIFTAVVMVWLSAGMTMPALASSYSSDNKKTISIDKKIRSIHDSEYKDNISSSDKVFYEEDVLEFKITVENTGDGVLKNINVTDMLPSFLTLVFNPGEFDSTNNKIKWTIDELKAGESKDFLIRAKIDNSEGVKTLTKETNVAEVSVDELGDRDDASYYIGDGVSIPNTGDTSLIIKTVLVLSLIGGGVMVRKYARGY